MTPAEAKALWDEVSAKGKALRACAGPHDFELLNPDKTVGRKYRCRLCGGEMDAVAKLHYEQGLAHGRRTR